MIVWGCFPETLVLRREVCRLLRVLQSSVVLSPPACSLIDSRALLRSSDFGGLQSQAV